LLHIPLSRFFSETEERREAGGGATLSSSSQGENDKLRAERRRSSLSQSIPFFSPTAQQTPHPPPTTSRGGDPLASSSSSGTTTSDYSSSSCSSSSSSSLIAATHLTPEEMDALLLPAFVFAFIWSMGGCLKKRCIHFFSRYVEELFQDLVHLPRGEEVYDCSLDLAAFYGPQYYQSILSKDSSSSPSSSSEETGASSKGASEGGSYEGNSHGEKSKKILNFFTTWDKQIPVFKYKPNLPYFSLLVPTKETIRATFLVDKMIQARRSVFLTGSVGVGKTAVLGRLLADKREAGQVHSIFLSFSARTKSSDVQRSIESKLDRKRKNWVGTPPLTH
ncbi:atpase family associated with various cellular activities domain-containing protein, partial [Cystoisospora suis]